MASPVTKFRHFSRLYSLNAIHSGKPLNSPKLSNNTPEFPVLPDENVRQVDTPCSDKSPNLCSTPASCLFKAPYEDHLPNIQHHMDSSRSSFGNSRCKFNDLSKLCLPTNGNQLSSTRKRCLGISETITAAKPKIRQEMIRNLAVIRQIPDQVTLHCITINRSLPGVFLQVAVAVYCGSLKSDVFLNQKKPVVELISCDSQQEFHELVCERENAKCHVFSTSVVPCVSPCKQKSNILRLSGIFLSPNSVSWTAESPIQIQRCGDVNNELLSTNRFHFSSNNQEADSMKSRLQNPIEQCPPGKLYFWEDSEEEIVTEEKVGRGGFGQVFKGVYRGEKVAIKKLEHSFKPRQAVLETLKGEMQGLRLCHANIVRTLVVIQSSSSSDAKLFQKTCYVVMEHAGSRNLSQVINNSNENIPETRRYRYLGDVLKGLTYLHSNKLAHLDLKPSNVIVTSMDTCKLCDFGSCFSVTSSKDIGSEISSRDSNLTTTSSDSAISNSIFSARNTSSASSAKSSSQLMGTFIYRAPELLRGFTPTLSADIFSFSITAWQVWSRSPPYSGQHNHTAVFAVVAFGARPTIPQLTSLPGQTPVELADQIFFELLTQCWHADPANRPSAANALRSIEVCLQTVQQDQN